MDGKGLRRDSLLTIEEQDSVCDVNRVVFAANIKYSTNADACSEYFGVFVLLVNCLFN